MNDYTNHATSLRDELKILEEELKKLGIKNPADPAGWEVKMPDLDISNADENEVGDRNEELQANTLVLDELAKRYQNVVRALKKIDEGTYGFCEICSAPIEEDRLLANPAARTCKTHIGQEEGR